MQTIHNARNPINSSPEENAFSLYPIKVSNKKVLVKYCFIFPFCFDYELFRSFNAPNTHAHGESLYTVEPA